MSRASPTVGDNSEAAPREFASYFRRWQEIEDGKAELSEQSKDLFADMKALGYVGKATRAVFRDKRKELNADPADAQEQEAIYDLYWDALNRGLSGPSARPAPAHVENIDFSRVQVTNTTVPPHDPETGEIQESGDDAFVAVTVRDQLADADGVEPPSPDTNPVSVEPTSSQAEPEKPEADSSPASGAIQEPFEPLAFLKKDEVNARCKKQGDCKFAKHPQNVTCSDCGTAWAISQRKRGLAE